MKTVVFDFDGVIHPCTSGWKGIDVVEDEPTPGIREAIKEIRLRGYEVAVVSPRCAEPAGMETVKRYLAEYGIFVDRVQAEKPPAIVYIDDRAICFDGDSKSLPDKVDSFKPWNKQG